MNIKLVHFGRKYEKLSDFTLTQTSNLTTLSNDELDKFALKILELKRGSFQNVKRVLKQLDENYPFVIPNWLLIAITMLGMAVRLKIVSMIWFFKYCKATGKFIFPPDSEGKI